jgi:hypothetical protein
MPDARYSMPDARCPMPDGRYPPRNEDTTTDSTLIIPDVALAKAVDMIDRPRRFLSQT